MKKPHLVLGLSGGGDSAVSALLLRESYQVYCLWLDIGLGGGEDAAAMADWLGLPFEKKDIRRELEHFVCQPFVEDYLAGRTPLPCARCNPLVKFPALLQKAEELGAKVVTMSDSNGYVYDPNGIDLAYVKDLKEVRRGRIKEYAETHKDATYVADCTKVWTVPCDIALPCATQNEINKESAEALVKGGCTVVCEGANMPSTPEAIEVYLSNGILYGPAKASNAGGVATSGLEMSQNSERLSWSFEEVDAKLKGIMEGIFHASYDASVAAGSEGNLMVGANCAGFLKVATAMMAQGITY